MELSCKKILIDHHREPQTDFFDYGISDITKSSTAEMVYDFTTLSDNHNFIASSITTHNCICETPEGQKRLKNLGITNTQILDDLKIVEDENTLGQYWMEKIGLNPS